MAELSEVLDEVLRRHGDEVGTHYVGCWRDHVVCLAVYLRELEEESND